MTNALQTAINLTIALHVTKDAWITQPSASNVAAAKPRSKKQRTEPSTETTKPVAQVSPSSVYFYKSDSWYMFSGKAKMEGFLC